MNDYLDTLKNLTTSKDKKIKVKENRDEILMEVEIPEPNEILQELFIQMGEISNMSAGKRKDMAILRLAIIAEYDAASLYEKMAEETSDEAIRKVVLEIANEEKAHIGELEFLLEHVDPEHETNEEKGEEEAMELTGLDAAPNDG